MRFVLSAILFAQLSLGHSAHPASDPAFEPYQRAILGTGREAGQTCAILDGRVLEHAASSSGNDLRLYSRQGSEEREVPFALTESAAEPGDVETIPITDERVHGSVVDLDLHMPSRPYSEIDLNTPVRDFIATAEASGSERKGDPGTALGTVTLFDFSGVGLPGSTRLTLGESRFPWVHIKVRFMDQRGSAFRGSLKGTVFTGAQVPPSREAQVLYTTVAEVSDLHSDATWTYASVPVPAHVPIERIRVELDPAFKADFLRAVTIGAAPLLRGTVLGVAEAIEATIGRVNRASPGLGVPAIHYEHMHSDVAFASNLRANANVHVSIRNEQNAPLPIRAVVVEMRRRSLCFEAVPSERYTLRYGDTGLAAPAYGYARTFQAREDAKAASLGPEERNPGYKARGTVGGVLAHSPELWWVIVIAVLSLAGVLLVERMRKRNKKG